MIAIIAGVVLWCFVIVAYAVGTDLGSTATESRYVSIKWDDGHRSFTGHAADRVGELARK
jgi:tetrahydromethanopterin S-methyltransferase subunit E